MAPAFCSQLARSHDVSPVGTAAEAAHWLLIEDPSPWGAAAVEDADWFAEVQAALAHWHDSVPGLRVQLIRRGLDACDTPNRRRCIAVRAGERPGLREWSLSGYEELAALPVPQAFQAPASTEDPPDPLVLTCVNGRRDACCAKWGRPVARAATDTASDAAWQTSHLGGHRFAPTAVVLPHGTHYAWLRPDDMPDLLAAHRTGHIYDLDRVRGAVHRRRPVQAACLALRKRLGHTALGAVRGEIEATRDERWTVRVQAEGASWMAQVWQEPHEASFPHSCGSDEAKPALAWRVDWEGAGPPDT